MNFNNLIIMHTVSNFPQSASANRIVALAHSFKRLGYEVIILCEKNPNQDVYLKEKKYVYDEIEFRAYEKTNKIGKIKQKINFFNLIKSNFNVNEIDKIKCIYFTHKNYTLFNHLNLKMKSIESMVDITEFHEAFQFKRKYLDLKFLNHLFNIHFVIPNAKNIIAITTYIAKKLDNKNNNVIIIPPQVKIENYELHSNPQYVPIKILYAGTISNKDYIGEILEGFCALSDKEKDKFEFEIIGTSLEDFKKEFKNHEKYFKELSGILKIINRISKKELEKKLSETHFTILLRPIRKYSSAGFPSKVPESLAAGVPVILNQSSDLGIYIKDDFNGIIIENFSVDAVTKALKKVSNLNNEEYKKLSSNAYNTAKDKFDYKSDLERIKSFFEIMDSER